MELEELLVDFYGRMERQGPGSYAETRRALDLARLPSYGELRIADIGCGTGSSTLVLAEKLPARITAVDLFEPFLEELLRRAASAGVSGKIETLACSMDHLPWDDEAFDLIWSEGAIYNIGFERGVREWHRFLKTGGVLAVSEITWLTEERPDEIEEYWNKEYTEISTAAVKLAQLQRAGYAPMAHFSIPGACWIDNFYTPMRDQFEPFLEDHPEEEGAAAIVAEQREEIALYETYRDYYSYCFYVARKL